MYVMYSAASISVLGQIFRPGDFVCLEMPSDDNYPTFGQIVFIIVPEDFKLLIVKKLKTESYSAHLNAYSVITSPS